MVGTQDKTIRQKTRYISTLRTLPRQDVPCENSTYCKIKNGNLVKLTSSEFYDRF